MGRPCLMMHLSVADMHYLKVRFLMYITNTIIIRAFVTMIFVYCTWEIKIVSTVYSGYTCEYINVLFMFVICC